MKRMKRACALLLSLALLLALTALSASAVTVVEVGDTLHYNCRLFEEAGKTDDAVKIVGKLALGENGVGGSKDYDEGYVFKAPQTGFYGLNARCYALNVSEPILGFGELEVQMNRGYAPWCSIESAFDLLVYLEKDDTVMINAWNWVPMAQKLLTITALGEVTAITPPDLSRAYLLGSETATAGKDEDGAAQYRLRTAAGNAVYWTVAFKNGATGKAELPFTIDELALKAGTQTIHVAQYGLKKDYSLKLVAFEDLITFVELPADFTAHVVLEQQADGSDRLLESVQPSDLTVHFSNGSEQRFPVQATASGQNGRAQVLCPDGTVVTITLAYSNYDEEAHASVPGNWFLIVRGEGVDGHLLTVNSAAEYRQSEASEERPGLFTRILRAIAAVFRWFFRLFALRTP